MVSVAACLFGNYQKWLTLRQGTGIKFHADSLADKHEHTYKAAISLRLWQVAEHLSMCSILGMEKALCKFSSFFNISIRRTIAFKDSFNVSSV